MTIRVTFQAALLMAAAILPLASAQADPIDQKAALCAACHGGAGKPSNPSIPVLWGQNEGYIYLELHDYKTGARKHPVMSPIASGLSKEDMKALAALFADKQWPNLGLPSATPDVAKHAQSVNDTAACQGCHLDQWQGDGATPRIGGQTTEYLRDTMLRFRSGERANNPWMSALLKTYSDDDIDALAKYLAGL